MWRLTVAAEGRLTMERRLVPLVEGVTLEALVPRRAEELTVRVTGPEGVLAGARVLLDGDDRFWRRAPFIPDWIPEARRGATGDDGTLVLARAVGEPVSVQAAADGLAPSRLGAVRGRSAILALAAGEPRTVEVRDARGAPIPEALVLLAETGLPLALTDDAGRARVAVGGGGPTELEVTTADGRAGSLRLAGGGLGGDRGQPRTATLADLERLDGRVLDAVDREPVAGALVWSWDAAHWRRSEADGAFSVAWPGSGRRRMLGVAAAGYFTEYRRDPPPGDALTLALRPAAAIRGRVVDGDGAAVAGAEVRASPDLGGLVAWNRRGSGLVLSDESGEFRVGSLDPETPGYELEARAPGWAPARFAVRDLQPRETRSGIVLTLRAGRRVVGTVLDASGQGLAGAEVRLDEALGTTSLPAAARRRFQREERQADAISGSGGRFEIAHQEEGRFDVEIRAAGHAPLTRPAVEIAAGGGELDLGEFELQGGASIEGRVADTGGRPLEGATIRSRAAESPFGLSFVPGAETQAAVSGPDGRFVLGDLAPGARLDLTVSLDGFAQRRIDAVSAPTDEPLEVVLERGVRVAGRVLDPGRRPIEGAEVLVEPAARAAGPAGHLQRAPGAVFGSTDADGRFDVDGAPAGRLRLLARAEDRLDSELAGLEAAPGDVVDGLEIVLEAGATLLGRIYGPDGEPLAGAHLMLRTGMGTFTGSGDPSDAEGNYRMAGLETGSRQVVVMHRGAGQIQRQVEIRPGDNRVDFTYERGVEVSGRVVDETGQPVAGATVWLVDEGNLFGRLDAASGADGAFRLDAVPDGRYRVTAQRESFAAVEVPEPLVVAGAPVAGLELVLGRGAAIAGRIAGVPEEELADLTLVAFSRGGRPVTGQVRADATYRIDHLAPGHWTVMAADEARGRQAHGLVTLEPGQAEALLDLELGGGLVLAGRVLRGGEPLVGATVQVSGVDVSSEGRARTDPSGGFSVDGLEAGRHRVGVLGHAEALLTAREINLTGDDFLEIEIRTASVSGRVVDGSGAALAAALVTLEPAAPALEAQPLAWAARPAARSDRDGVFDLGTVAAGAYRLRAVKQGYSPGEMALVVEPEIDLGGLEIVLEGSPGLVLEVAHDDGRAASQVLAALVGPTGAVVAGDQYVADAGGVVRMDSVPRGSWELLVSASGYASPARQVVVPAAGPVAVTLWPAARLEIEIPELAGDPTRATAVVTAADGRPFRLWQWGQLRGEWHLTDGRGMIDRLPPGDWRLRVTAAGGRSWERALTLGPGERRREVLP